ncbi:Glycoside hydrolase family 28 protein [Mycena venus]|uniref:endo-polygalacturonase n=1 Tax=Mycena venus TaxID=2733690 RepID=A0A8H7DEQ8_9AGAR|nr:Glycoside hydrolase family 28 protein [Mycena venus]
MFAHALIVALLSAAAHACTGTVSSLTDVAAAVACTTINVNGFTVPAGQTFTLNLLAGTTVNIRKIHFPFAKDESQGHFLVGDITFGEKNWGGPLFSITLAASRFCCFTMLTITPHSTVAPTLPAINGNGHTFNGNGQFYWDGKGSSSGATTKPRPMMKVKTSGTFSNLKILNSPAQVFSVDNAAPLTISGITIDDYTKEANRRSIALGDQANTMSGGKPAGANTDGFDVGNQAPLTITGCTVENQDDCIAINSGTNVVFTSNHCSGGHGISIGSIDTGDVVSNITISNNVITSGANGLRIKTIATATSATVSGVTYSGNTVSGVSQFGLLIDQSYPATLGTPGNGVIISGINFVGTNTFTIASGVTPVAVNCGSGSCQGTWNWSGLKVSGGAANKINYSGITGFSE